MKLGGHGRPLRGIILLGIVLAVSACSIQIPISPGESTPGTAGPGDRTAAPEESAPADSSPATLPPLTRAQITGEDMTFARGTYIEPGQMVAFSDGILRMPGWTQTKLMVNGESVYASDRNCTASMRYTQVQDPLVVDGDDKASTEALFRFLDPSILPEYLMTTSWLWGESPGDATASIEFLTYMQEATGETPASALSLRLFHATRTGIAFTVTCESNDELAPAVADVRSRISVVPPG